MNNSPVLVVFGTRPEAIKLCPLVPALRRAGQATHICVTAQHRHLLDQVLSLFEMQPDSDLDLMQAGQTLTGLTARVLSALEPVLAAVRPSLVVVQGDTTTTMAGALAAFYQRIPVAHVEAGLRTGDLWQPFPEELNRVLASRLAQLHFAPTRQTADNLIREGIPPAAVTVTGNTGIDALLYTRQKLEQGQVSGFSAAPLTAGKRLILVTAHRRESFGDGFVGICQALNQLASRGDVQIVYPVHPNPNVRGIVVPALGNTPGITLVEPQEYVPFVDLMRRADLILTDSGGIQEEAPSFHKPVLVLRDKTERQEAITAGTARLVGTDPAAIVSAATDLLENEVLRKAMTTPENPFGDGQACPRIARIIATFLKT